MSRQEFSRDTKRKAFARCCIDGMPRCEGLRCNSCDRHFSSIATVGETCPKCHGGLIHRCGKPLQSGRFTYDHRDPDYFSKDNSLENCQVLGWCCDKPKTAADQGAIAKSKRVNDRSIGALRSKYIMPGSKRSKWKRKMDGSVVLR